MPDIRNWSTTPADNATAGSINWAEGQPPSTVNDSARQMMADARGQWNDGGWFVWGDTHTYASATATTTTGDQRTTYPVSRRIRAAGTTTGTIYGTVAAVTYSANTAITYTWDSGSLTNETLSIAVSYISPTGTPISPDMIQGGVPDGFNIVSLSETTTVAYYTDFVPIYNSSSASNQKVRPEYFLGLMAGHLYGLTLSNNGTDANNDIDIAVGRAVDNTTFALMELTSALTKQLDAAWAVGTNQGGLDTGTEAVSTWYYVYLIQRPDTGVVDVLFSTSATSPTMPANYTNKRRLGAFYNDSAGNILAFTQVGDIFNYASARVMNSGTDGTFSNTAPTLVAISLAAFAPSTASELIGSAANNYSAGALANVYVHNRSTSAGWQSTSNIPFVTLNGASTDTQSFSMPILSSNIYWTSQAAGGAVFAKGWIDRRGRDTGV